VPFTILRGAVRKDVFKYIIKNKFSLNLKPNCNGLATRGGSMGSDLPPLKPTK